MQITVNSQLQELNDHIGTIYLRLNGDLTPFMSAIGTLLEGSTRDRFRTKTAPDGSSWEDLKPSTKAAKNNRGGILVDYGDLMRSITYHASNDAVAVGSDRPYAKFPQTGTKNADGSERMVKRDFLGLSIDDKANIRDLMFEFMESAVNG